MIARFEGRLMGDDFTFHDAGKDCIIFDGLEGCRYLECVWQRLPMDNHQN